MYTERTVEERDQEGNIRTRKEYSWTEQTSATATKMYDSGCILSKSWTTKDATMGAFTISDYSLDLMHDWTTFIPGNSSNLNDSEIGDYQEQIKKEFQSCKATSVKDKFIYLRMSGEEGATVAGDEDNVGDYKMNWSYVPSGKAYTIVAQ